LLPDGINTYLLFSKTTKNIIFWKNFTFYFFQKNKKRWFLENNFTFSSAFSFASTIRASQSREYEQITYFFYIYVLEITHLKL
jgi:hypothetical protein